MNTIIKLRQTDKVVYDDSFEGLERNESVVVRNEEQEGIFISNGDETGLFIPAKWREENSIEDALLYSQNNPNIPTFVAKT